MISLHEDVVNILLFSPKGVRIDTKVSRTDSPLMVPTADSLLGHVLNPFGSPLSDSTPMPKVKTYRSIDTAPSGISTRAKVTKQMATGTALVDIVIPIGEGQKQLVLHVGGDNSDIANLFGVNRGQDMSERALRRRDRALRQRRHDVSAWAVIEDGR